MDTREAEDLGYRPDASIDEVIAAFLEDERPLE